VREEDEENDKTRGAECGNESPVVAGIFMCIAVFVRWITMGKNPL